MDARSKRFPTDDFDLLAPAEVRWNEQGVPHQIIEDKRDVPNLVGWTHGHLRRAPLEILGRIGRAFTLNRQADE